MITPGRVKEALGLNGPSGQRNVYMIILCCACVLVLAPTNMPSMYLSDIAIEMHMSESERDAYLGGWLSAALMIGQIIGTSVGGGIASQQKFDRGHLICCMLGLCSLSVVLWAFSTYSVLFTLRLFTGISQGAIVPIVFSILADLYPAGDRPAASAIISAAIGAGMLFGQLFAGYMFGILSWSSQIAVVGLVSGFMIFAVYFVFKDPPRGLFDSDASEEDKGNEGGDMMISPSRFRSKSSHKEKDSSKDSSQNLSLLREEREEEAGHDKVGPCRAIPSWLAGHFLGVVMAVRQRIPRMPKFIQNIYTFICGSGSSDDNSSGLFANASIPTVTLLLVQALPVTVPWGVLGVFLTDYLTHECQLRMDFATTLIACFGAGAAIGGIGGGYLGGWLYKRDKKAFCLFIGITVVGAGAVMWWLVRHGFDHFLAPEPVLEGPLPHMSVGQIKYVADGPNAPIPHRSPGVVGAGNSLGVPHEIEPLDLDVLSWPFIAVGSLVALSGCLASVNGANVRAALLNLSYPVSRGAVIGFANLLNCIGRGVGPLLAKAYIEKAGATRQEAIEICLSLWLITGLLLCSCAVTISTDVDMVASSSKSGHLPRGVGH